MPTPAEACIARGDPQGALALLQQQVREHAGDPKLRVFLFQLLCVLGQWPRALTQLKLCGELDAGALAMANTYGPALHCEALREQVFAAHTTPMAFGQPRAWLALLVEALQADARGHVEAAARLREQAFADAAPSAGTLDGEPFDWIADADSRLGPVLEAVINGRYSWVPFEALARVSIEAPVDLRDLVWAPAHLQFVNGGDTVALIPTRYAGTAAGGDARLQLARGTDWLPLGPDHYKGLGQRVLATSAGDRDLLAIREIVIAPGADATATATAAAAVAAGLAPAS